MSEYKEWRITPSHDHDWVFTGKKLGWMDDTHVRLELYEVGSEHKLLLEPYEVESEHKPRYICVRTIYDWFGDNNECEVCAHLQEVYDFFGYNTQAKELYELCGIDKVIVK